MNGTVTSPSQGRLWFGIAAAPAAWSLTELAGYALASGVCASPSGHPVAAVLPLASVTIALGVAGFVIAFGNVRRTNPTQPDGDEYPMTRTELAVVPSRVRFMALGGLMASSLFLAGTVLFAIPSLVVHGCAGAR